MLSIVIQNDRKSLSFTAYMYKPFAILTTVNSDLNLARNKN